MRRLAKEVSLSDALYRLTGGTWKASLGLFRVGKVLCRWFMIKLATVLSNRLSPLVFSRPGGLDLAFIHSFGIGGTCSFGLNSKQLDQGQRLREIHPD